MDKLHLRKLCEGAVVWREWRERDHIKVPDLQGCNLRGRDLKDFNLQGANLQRADLRGANLQRADLEGADLQGADLWDAELGGAKLICTNMMGVTISVDKLLHADLWTRSDVPRGKAADRVCKVVDWINECRERIKESNFTKYAFYYRGAKCYCYPPEPSVMRSSSHRRHESEMLTDLMGRRPEDFEKQTMALDQWSLARHYDLPTRLLDVTPDPLVALYFASQRCERCCKDRECGGDGRLDVFKVHSDWIKRFNSDTIRVIANFAKLDHRKQDAILNGCCGKVSYYRARGELYQNIRQERPQFEELIDPRHFLQVFLVKPRQSFERIRAQSGAFLLSAYHGNLSSIEVRKKMEKNRDLIPLYRHWKLRVPSCHKIGILHDLSMLNVTDERLFPDLSTAVDAVKKEHKG